MASVEAGCFPTAAVWVKHLLDEWDRWPGGPLIVFPETLLSPGHHLRGVAGSGGRRPLQEPRRARPAALLAAAFRGPAGRAPSALYTESGRTPPASLMPPTLHDARAFSTALERGFHGGRGPGLCFLHIPAGPDPSAATGPCPSHPVFRVTSEQTSMWLVWGWENFTNIRT